MWPRPARASCHCRFRPAQWAYGAFFVEGCKNLGLQKDNQDVRLTPPGRCYYLGIDHVIRRALAYRVCLV